MYFRRVFAFLEFFCNSESFADLDDTMGKKSVADGSDVIDDRRRFAEESAAGVSAGRLSVLDFAHSLTDRADC